MSRIVDVLSNHPTVDPKGFIAFGFSRFGKTALWAAAQDKRFAAVISNESGQAGATLSHRQIGEPIDHLCSRSLIGSAPTTSITLDAFRAFQWMGTSCSLSSFRDR
jgi:dienelactone hydrolase